MLNNKLKFTKVCLSVSFIIVVISLVMLCLTAHVKTYAAELGNLAAPTKLETIVPTKTKIPEKLAYGANNGIDVDKVEIIQGSEYWKLMKLESWFALVPKNAFLGRQVKNNLPTCKLKFPNFITDFNDQDLDCYVTVNVKNFRGTTSISGIGNSYYPSPFGANSKNATLDSRAFDSGGKEASGISACFRTNYNVSFTYAGTNDLYVSDYPAAWIYADIDRPSNYYNDDASVVKKGLTDNTDDYFYTESVQLGNGTKKTYIANDNDLFISTDNRFFCNAFDDVNDMGEDSFDKSGVAVINDAGSFDISWAGSYGCGTAMFFSGNYYCGLKLKKISSEESFDYPTKGAVYGLYEDENCNVLNRRLTLDETGEAKSAGTLDLDSKTYYLKELSSPEGYRLDDETHAIDLSSQLGKWAEVTLKDDPLKYEIKTKVENGIISDSKTLNYGESKKIEYAPRQGYHLKSVVVDGVVADINKYPTEYNFIDVKENHSIEVTYESDIFNIDPNAINGTITKKTVAEYGSSKTIEYAPKEGYHIASVTVDGHPVDIEEHPSSYTFSDIKSDHVIEVVFEIDQFTITTYVKNGTITESTTVKWGENKTIEYSPKDGYHLSSVVVDEEEQDLNISKESHDFNKVSSDHEVEVVYESDSESDENDDTSKDETDTKETSSATNSNSDKTTSKTEKASSNAEKASSNPEKTSSNVGETSSDAKKTSSETSDDTSTVADDSSGKKSKTTSLPTTGDASSSKFCAFLGICFVSVLTSAGVRMRKK